MSAARELSEDDIKAALAWYVSPRYSLRSLSWASVPQRPWSIPTFPTAGSAAITPEIDDLSGGVPDGSTVDALVGDVVAGVPGSTDQLLRLVRPLVLRYCYGRLGRRETGAGSAEDVAQEICLAALSALPGYRATGQSFRAFIYGIAAQKVADAYRTAGRNRSDPVAELPDEPLDHADPEQSRISVELTEQLTGLLDRLTPNQREVLVLRVAVGLSAEETAAIIGSTPGAVRITQHHALTLLQSWGRLVWSSEPQPATPRDADLPLDANLAAAFTTMTEDLTEQVLDLHHGYDDATRQGHYTDLATGLASLLDTTAGLAAVLQTDVDPPDGSR